VCCWWSSQLDSALHLRSQPWKVAPARYLLDAARQIKNYLLCLFVWNPVAGVEIFLVPHWDTLALLGHLSIVCTASIKYSPWKFHTIFSWSCSFGIMFFCWLTSVKEPSGICHSHLWVREMLRMFLLVGLWCVHGDSVCGHSPVNQRGPTQEVQKWNESSSRVLFQVWDSFCWYV